MTHTAPHDHAAEGGHAPGHADDAGHQHDHAHSHGHDHDHSHAPAAEQAPRVKDDLILDIGGDIGALVIRASADRDLAEVEISPVGEQARKHNIVRRREAPSGAVYAAVFPDVVAGEYTVWHDATTPAGTVSVQGGRVTNFRLDQG